MSYRCGRVFVCIAATAYVMTFATSACSSIKGVYRAVANSSATGFYKVGNPYEIDGKWYYPREDYFYNEVGVASWYGADFHNGITANGEKYDMHAMTAAHKTLPLPSIVRVTNLENGKSVILRVNDRGPFYENRIIDVSKYAAERLGFHRKGTTKVRVEIMAKESKELKQAMLNKEKWAKNAYKNNDNVSYDTASYNNTSKKTYNTAGSNTKQSVYKTSIRSVTKTPANPKNVYTPYTGYTEEPVDVAPLHTVSATYNEVGEASLFVQTGAFSVKENADRFAEEMKQYGDVSIFKEGTVYKVRLGPFATGEEAEMTLNNVNATGLYDGRIIDVSN